MYELLLCVVVGWKTRSGTSYAVDPPVGSTCGHCPVGRIAAFPGYTTGTWGWTWYPPSMGEVKQLRSAFRFWRTNR